MTRIGRSAALVVPVLGLLATPVAAQGVLFDFGFDSTPQHTLLPVSVTAGVVTATFSATGECFSIEAANVMGFTPAASPATASTRTASTCPP